MELLNAVAESATTVSLFSLAVLTCVAAQVPPPPPPPPQGRPLFQGPPCKQSQRNRQDKQGRRGESQPRRLGLPRWPVLSLQQQLLLRVVLR